MLLLAQIEAFHKRMVTFLALQLTKPDVGQAGSPTSELVIKVVNLVVGAHLLPLLSANPLLILVGTCSMSVSAALAFCCCAGGAEHALVH